MNYREEIRQYVTEVWNYNQAVVDAFDDYDYELIKNTAHFQMWNFKRACTNFGVALYNPFCEVTEKIKRAFK